MGLWIKKQRLLQLSLGLTVVFLSFGFAPQSEKTPPVIFTHGVASGDVTPFAAVLWTRVVAKEKSGERKKNDSLSVKIEVALNPDFRRLHFSRELKARAANDFTVKVLATPLLPSRTYYYRWRKDGVASPVGTFKTAPRPDLAASVRFTWTGDSDGTRVKGVPAWNNFEVLDAVRAENADFFLYLGDTVYPDSAKRTAPPASTVQEFWDSYKEVREYPALQKLLKTVSTFAVWDDHEVRDDYAGQTVDPALYAAGRRAFLDYLPTEEIQFPSPGCAGTPRFRVFAWGKDVDLIILDTHSCRSASALPACTYPAPLPPNTFDLAPTLPDFVRAANPDFFPPLALIPQCLSTINDPSRTMLGETQKQLFKDALLTSKARFKFVVSPSTFSQTYLSPYSRWEGYGAERTELIRFIRDNALTNVVFLSTDDHRNLIHEVFVDRLTEPGSVGTEFVTGPIAHLTDQATVLDFFGLPPETDCTAPGNAQLAGCRAVVAEQAILSFAGASCRHLNKYSYGLVEVNATTGLLEVILKDDQGKVIIDQVDQVTECTRVLGP